MGGTRDTSTSTTQGEIMKTFLRRKGIACQLLAAILLSVSIYNPHLQPQPMQEEMTIPTQQLMQSIHGDSTHASAPPL